MLSYLFHVSIFISNIFFNISLIYISFRFDSHYFHCYSTLFISQFFCYIFFFMFNFVFLKLNNLYKKVFFQTSAVFVEDRLFIFALLSFRLYTKHFLISTSYFFFTSIFIPPSFVRFFPSLFSPRFYFTVYSFL